MTILSALFDYLRRALLLIAALLLTTLGCWLASRISAWWLLLAVPAGFLSVVGLYDALQRHNVISRNYPLAAHIRWIGLDLRPYFRAYMVEDDLEGRPYSIEARRLVKARASGSNETHPFGTELDVDADGYGWLNHSIAPAEHPDEHPRVQVGNGQCARPYSASLLNISAMSFGSLSANAVRALNLGAKQGDFYHDTGEGGLSRYHLEQGGDVVWEIGSGYFGCRDNSGHFDPEMFRDKAAHDSVKMTEIKLSQGAKPGHGGMLPAAKVTAEIAEVRHVPEHRDCLSPRGHSAFSTPIEMLEFAARMRDLSGGKPVGIKLCVGQPHEVFAVMKAMLETGIRLDFIVVDGAEGGTGAAPLELSNHVGTPLRDGLILMRNALVGCGLKDEVRLAASGKIFSAYGMAEQLALGADWCNAARAFLFSIGCIQAQRCHTGTCPTGITTQDPIRQRAVMPQVQGRAAARFHAKTMAALADVIAAAGCTHAGELQPHHLSLRKQPGEAAGIDAIEQFLKPGQLLADPDSTPYARHWNAASATSFRPRQVIDPPRPALAKAH